MNYSFITYGLIVDVGCCYRWRGSHYHCYEDLVSSILSFEYQWEHTTPWSRYNTSFPLLNCAIIIAIIETWSNCIINIREFWLSHCLAIYYMFVRLVIVQSYLVFWHFLCHWKTIFTHLFGRLSPPFLLSSCVDSFFLLIFVFVWDRVPYQMTSSPLFLYKYVTLYYKDCFKCVPFINEYDCHNWDIIIFQTS